MKYILDKFTIDKSTNLSLEDTMTAILKRIENSDKLDLKNNRNQNTIIIASKELEMMTTPRTPKYQAKIELHNTNNKTEIKAAIKGNSIFRFFKYLSLLVFTIGITIWTISLFHPLINPFDNFLLNSLAPLAFFFILNILNRNHIIVGHQEVLKVINV